VHAWAAHHQTSFTLLYQTLCFDVGIASWNFKNTFVLCSDVLMSCCQFQYDFKSYCEISLLDIKPSIFHRHAISITFYLSFGATFIIQVSELCNKEKTSLKNFRGCPASYDCICFPFLPRKLEHLTPTTNWYDCGKYCNYYRTFVSIFSARVLVLQHLFSCPFARWSAMDWKRFREIYLQFPGFTNLVWLRTSLHNINLRILMHF